MPTVVYRYGCPSAWRMPDWLDHQFRAGHELRQRLVALEHAYEQQVRDLWSAQPDVAAAEQRAADLEKLVARLKAKGPAVDVTAVRQARADLLRARQDVRRAMDSVPGKVIRQLNTLRAHHQDQVTGACTRSVAIDGLNYDLRRQVMEQHEAAVDRVRQARERRGHAELRSPRPWDGTCSGALVLQPRYPQSCNPPLLAEDDNPWRTLARLRPWMPPDEHGRLSRAEQRSLGRGELRIRLAGGILTVPVQIHRMLPADAEVTRIELVRRRIAGGHRHHISVTARVPDPAPVTDGPTVAVRPAARTRPNGARRAAVWAASEPLTVPPELSDVVVAMGDGRWGEIVFPGRWTEAFEMYACLAERRNREFEAAREGLAAWVEAHPERSPWTVGQVRGWTSPEELAAEMKGWDDDARIGERMRAWRAGDRRLAEWHAHGTRQAFGRRDDAYRRAAAWLTGRCATLVVTDAVAGDNEVAPGRLRRALCTAASRRGVATVEKKVARPSCPHCDRPGPKTGRVVVSCRGCEGIYDQDAAVARRWSHATDKGR